MFQETYKAVSFKSVLRLCQESIKGVNKRSFKYMSRKLQTCDIGDMYIRRLFQESFQDVLRVF